MPDALPDDADRPTGPVPELPEREDPDQTMVEHGELRVITTVKGLTSGATLYLDLEKKGTTPVSIQVTAGKHMIRVERSGYKALEREIAVTANQVTPLRLELQAS